jgi:hypothetical protein
MGAGLAITAGEGPEAPIGYNVLGSYQIVMNDIAFYTTLSWKDFDSSLKTLNITLIWAQNGQNDIDEAERSFALTTYVLK